MKEIWRKIEPEFRNQVVLAEVNCEQESDLCNEFRVGSYPTIFAFPAYSATNTNIFHYNGARRELDKVRTDLLSIIKKANIGKPVPFIKQLLSDQQFKQSCIMAPSRTTLTLVGCVIFNLPTTNSESEEIRHFERLQILTKVRAIYSR